MTSTPSTGTTSPTPGTAPSCGPADRAAALRVVGVSYAYGTTRVVDDISFELGVGQFLTLLGPSGCGKTTLLKWIGGYLVPGSANPQAGRVFVRGRDVTLAPPDQRNLGMVFQNYALFPHLSARDNVGFGLDVRRVGRADRDRRVDAMLERVGLSDSESRRFPTELSGGQQQRVALARALIFGPDVLLLDEPLANLDRRLREQMRGELRRIQRDTGVAAVMVTHDQEEALAISDYVGVMHAGRLLQLGTPSDVYHRPNSSVVARFLGEANIVSAAALGLPGHLAYMIRPENVALGSDAEACSWHRQGVLTGVTFLGCDAILEIAVEPDLPFRARVRPTRHLVVGQRIQIGVRPEDAWPLPETSP